MDDILLETEVQMVNLQASTLAVINCSFVRLFLFFSLLSTVPVFSSSHIFDSNKDHSKSIRTKNFRDVIYYERLAGADPVNIMLPIFPKNYMKLRKFWSEGGGGGQNTTCRRHPLVPPLANGTKERRFFSLILEY